MSTPISIIETFLQNPPFSLLTAHPWYSDHPTDSDPAFAGTGYFTVHSGVDPAVSRPWGFVYEIHDIPAGTAFNWLDAIQYQRPFGHIVNMGRLAGGYSSTIPVEEILLDRPRGAFKLSIPSTDELILEVLEGAYVQLWGLYIDIPLVSPIQMDFTSTSTTATIFQPTFDGTTFHDISGDGQLVLDAGTVGVRIDATVVPGRVGEEGTSPITMWDLGWINVADPYAFETRERIRSQHWLSRRFNPNNVTSIGYHIEPDVLVDITCRLPNIS